MVVALAQPGPIPVGMAAATSVGAVERLVGRPTLQARQTAPQPPAGDARLDGQVRTQAEAWAELERPAGNPALLVEVVVVGAPRLGLVVGGGTRGE